MRQGAEAQKKEAAQAKSAIKSIEAEAAEQYARDPAAAKAQREAMNGTWEADAGSGYLYNAVQRWYYDVGTSMYYGGEPAAWTSDPAIPTSARYRPATQQDTPEAGMLPDDNACMNLRNVCGGIDRPTGHCHVKLCMRL